MHKYLSISIFSLCAILITGCTTTIYTRPTPPPPRVEVIPKRPRVNVFWVPGHWAWRGRQRKHVWVPGHWKIR